MTGQPASVDGKQRGRRDERDVGAERGERERVAAGDARVEDVADDRDAGAVEDGAEVAAQGEQVEQGLRGVLVAAVAGVDDAGVDPGRRPGSARRRRSGA